MIDTEKIKQRINCVDYLNNYVGIYAENGKRYVSPLRRGASNPTSFYVTNDFFYDFGMAQGGDVIDLCAIHKFDGDKGRAIYYLAEKLKIPCSLEACLKEQKQWLRYTNKLNNKIAKWHSRLTDEDYEYLHNRGISDDTIKRYRIGRTTGGRLSLPYYKNGYCCYYATRAMPHCKSADRKYMKMPIDDYNEHIVFGLDTITDDRSLIVIAEGMFDCLSFIDSGYSCISAVTGHFSSKQLKTTVLPLLKTFKRVLIVYDNDAKTHAGEKFTYKMANVLAKNQIPFVVGKVPQGFKDISEVYADRRYHARGLQDIVENANDGISFLVNQLSSPQDFVEFMLEVCDSMKSSQIICIFNELFIRCTCFDKTLIREVKKMCLKAPSEVKIAEQITNENKIKYNPAIGHFTWNGRYWEKRLPEYIMQFVTDKLGDNATGTKVKSVLKLIEIATATTDVFNNKPVLNFRNGTLELEPKLKFREHSIDDMCTYCLPYDYDKHAEFSEWEHFIETVTDYDSRKAACLQEFAGYILYPDNSMQKALCCIGGGSNGKSLFLNVLSKVIGSENISNVEMSAFAQDFQRINLMSSMLNISSETRSNVAQAESYFKSIVAGDTCSACYKGKDYITFTPRAKVIMSCNEYLKPNDTSDGFLRRLLFVKFPIKFCDNPDPNKSNEQPIDRTLEAKFSKPEYLSGVMNWVIDGYKQLRAVGEFTQADDANELQEEFKALTNPIIDFLTEFKMPFDINTHKHSVTNSCFYEHYAVWCIKSGHKPASKRKFLLQASQLISEYRPDITHYRTATERGYELTETG